MKIKQIINSMKEFRFYVDRPNLLRDVTWERIGNASVTLDRKSHEEASFVLPVKIISDRCMIYHIPYLFTYLSYRLFVGPLGAYSCNVCTMEKAKYRMTCTAPDDPELTRIFEEGIHVFSHLQNSISKSLDQRHLLESVNDEHHLITNLPVFEKRVRILSTTVLKQCLIVHPIHTDCSCSTLRHSLLSCSSRSQRKVRPAEVRLLCEPPAGILSRTFRPS
jgi:hypothetical protein